MGRDSSEGKEMKTIKCDRCGKDIPYVPPYMNAAKQGVLPPTLIITIWEPLAQKSREVDLCDSCKKAVYDFIFDYSKGNEA